ncbi:MAG TPA: HAD-IA family hydrolase [Candidatus Saccharimonadales bacterium]|jgi:putative hydrolase of the HAD superfamily|nr:HAD-IA family hydrolase [Candidatus Saccharimonadales bacterium]
MYKAIIFDCFDVLVSNGLPLFVKQYLGESYENHTAVLKLEESLNFGRIDYETFLLKMSEMGNVSIDETRRILDNNQPDIELFDYIEHKLKPKYKIGMLSNAGDDWLDEMMGPKRKALFEVLVLSYQVGYTKPQPEIYRLTASKLGVKPSQCIMIDDKKRYCEGAFKVGMQAIQYQSVNQMIVELDSILRK